MEPKKNLYSTRLSNLISALGISQNAFAAELGTSGPRISNITKGRNGPDSELLSAIVARWPLVNPRWLLTGEGEMLLDAHPNAHLNAHPSTKFQNERDKKRKTAIQVVGGAGADPARAYLTGASLEVRSVVVPVDTLDELRITIVGEDVYAGYQRGYADPEFVGTLPTFNIPTLPRGRTYRAFQVRGDSMAPTLLPRDLIVCSYVQDLRHLRNDYVYVIVSPSEGLVVKRITNRITQRRNPHIVCHSDNPEYQPFILAANHEEISELWQAEMRLTTHLQAPPPTPELVTRVAVLEMQYQDLMERLQPAQTPLKGVFFDD